MVGVMATPLRTGRQGRRNSQVQLGLLRTGGLCGHLLKVGQRFRRLMELALLAGLHVPNRDPPAMVRLARQFPIAVEADHEGGD